MKNNINELIKKAKNFISAHKKQTIYLSIIAVSIIAIIIRLINIKVESEDYILYLKPWVQIIKEEGGLASLKNEIGNYNIPYMTILALISYLPIEPLIPIKCISIIFDFILAASAGMLVYKIVKKDNKLYGAVTYMITLILPTILANSSIWGQCDSIYVTFVILSLLYMVQDKYLKSFILLGISCAFKLQFIFIVPAYIIYLVSKKKYIKLTYFGIIPIVDFIMCIPAMIVGRPIKECMMIYISQAGENIDRLSMNFPNIYNFIGKIEGTFAMNYSDINYNIISVVTIGVIGFIMLLIYFKRDIDKKQMIKLSLWSVCITTFLLPHMHERYLYLGETLSVILAIIDNKYIPLALAINIISIITYLTYLCDTFLCDLRLLTIALGICVIYITIQVIKKEKNVDNKRILC